MAPTPSEPLTAVGRYPAKSEPFTVIQPGSIPLESRDAGAAAVPVLGVMLAIWIWLLLSPPPPRVPLPEAKLTVAGPD